MTFSFHEKYYSKTPKYHFFGGAEVIDILGRFEIFNILSYIYKYISLAFVCL